MVSNGPTHLGPSRVGRLACGKCPQASGAQVSGQGPTDHRGLRQHPKGTSRARLGAACRLASPGPAGSLRPTSPYCSKPLPLPWAPTAWGQRGTWVEIRKIPFVSIQQSWLGRETRRLGVRREGRRGVRWAGRGPAWGRGHWVLPGDMTLDVGAPRHQQADGPPTPLGT